MPPVPGLGTPAGAILGKTRFFVEGNDGAGDLKFHIIHLKLLRLHVQKAAIEILAF